MSIELDNFDLIKIQKDSGAPITFRFQDSNSVDDIDFALRNVLSIQKNLSYSLSYKNKNTGQDIYIVANGSMLLKCLKENINQLDLFVTPRTPTSLSSSPSNSNSQERDNLVQRWPELMKNIDRRIQRWTSRSDNTVGKNVNSSYEYLLETNFASSSWFPDLVGRLIYLLALVLIFCQGRLWLAAVQLSSPTSPPLKFYSKGYLIR
ncbi:unnamed protein product [Rotaria magnacalcarata]|uniref:Uncharacterized protein n=1 Tax=Rotaria magnacalcarata TaxID=392030 RepID=A0A816Z3A7_9BILA|nr:unnamed protein product [Rotaria magnacalcarata]